VMEHVAGQTLESLLTERRRLGVGESVLLLGQVAAALDHAHANGVVHRDVKPANVMVEPSGQVKVMDFGIAKVDSGANLTATGAILGTPNYMSPEQARGEPVDARSDLFSLGCVVYECLTGARPFQDDSVTGILLRVVAEPPAAVDFQALGLPRTLGGVLDRAMAKKPAERFASGAELIEAVRAAALAPATSGPDAPLTLVASGPRPSSAPLARWKLWTGAAAGTLALGLLAWIVTDPHAGSPAASGSSLVTQEPRGFFDRLLRRTPRLRVTIPEGTWLRLALETPVNSETAVESQPITAVTTAAVRVDGVVAVPKGVRVSGRVEHAASAQRADGRGEITIVFDALDLDGERVALRTKALAMRAPALRKEKDGKRGNKVLGAFSGLIDRIRGSGSSTEGGSAGTVTVSSTAGREIALREQAALAVELAAAVTVRRAKAEPAASE